MFSFSLQFCLKHFSFQDELREILSQIYIGLHVKYPLFLLDFNETSICSTDFPKNTPVSNFMKIRHVRAELFHVDGETDRLA